MTPPPGRLMVFGGSFDPPHLGHMNLLRNAMQAVQPDRVLVVPSGTAPHKAESVTPSDIRAGMCSCFCRLSPKVQVSLIEQERPGKSYTVDTLAALRGDYPGWTQYLCVGSDMLCSFTEWYHWQQILRLAVLVAMPRHSGELKAMRSAANALEKDGGQVVFAQGPVQPASSSDIRAAIAAGDQTAYALIPPPADAIAREMRLYDH